MASAGILSNVPHPKPMNDCKHNKASSPATKKAHTSPASAGNAEDPRNDDGYLDLHYSMLRVRRVEERLLEVFAQGKIPALFMSA